MFEKSGKGFLLGARVKGASQACRHLGGSSCAEGPMGSTHVTYSKKSDSPGLSGICEEHAAAAGGRGHALGGWNEADYIVP